MSGCTDDGLGLMRSPLSSSVVSRAQPSPVVSDVALARFRYSPLLALNDLAAKAFQVAYGTRKVENNLKARQMATGAIK
jgi:hypothetical protein